MKVGLGAAQSAWQARLRYVSCADAGITRIRRGAGFVYRLPNGKLLRDKTVLERIRKLALPPAWTDVWICSHPYGHLQATGVDARGRKQYRYAARWRVARDELKFGELLEFASRLPGLRRHLERDLSAKVLGRDKVLATVVSLMARTGARVGNQRYRDENGSFGLTTLLNRHATIKTQRVEFAFRGKGGKPYRATVRDAKLARIVKHCRDIPGQRLFQYVDAQGRYHAIGSADVNEYIQRSSGARFTAKTFRTWHASVLALAALRRSAPAATLAARKRQLNEALSGVAEQLGNTLAICRKSYVHSGLQDAYLQGVLPAPGRGKHAGLSAEETDLVMTLERLGHERQQLAA